MPTRPDILLISVDCLRYDAVDGATMPFAAELAGRRDSTFMRRCYAASSWTASSVASMHTGCYPDGHGVWLQKLPGSDRVRVQEPAFDRLLAQDLADAGYYTFCFQTNPLAGLEIGMEAGYAAFDQLGERPDEPDGAARMRFMRHLTLLQKLEVSLKAAVRGASVLLERCRKEESRMVELLRFRGRDRGDYLVRRFLRFAEENLDERPAFGWLHFMDLHTPYTPPADRFGRTRRVHTDPTKWGPEYTPADRRSVRRRYRACAGYVDELIAGAVERWRALRDRPTCVVLTSDHGEEFWDHGAGTSSDDPYELGAGHGHTLYDELIHVPLLIQGPGLGGAFREDGLCSLADLRPTVLGLAGLAAPSAIDGRNLLDRPERDWVMAEYMYSGPERKAVVAPPLKMIAREDGAEAEVYDLEADPGELHELSAVPDRPADSIREIWERVCGARAFAPSRPAAKESQLERLRAIGYI